jgi:hypothetical protein
VVELMPSKCKTLSLNPSAIKKRRRRRRRRRKEEKNKQELGKTKKLLTQKTSKTIR